MGNGENFATHPFVILVQIGPEIFDVLTFFVGIGIGLSRLLGSTFEDDVAVQHYVAAPFKADECGEGTRIVVPLCILNDLIPDGTPETKVRIVIEFPAVLNGHHTTHQAVVFFYGFRVKKVLHGNWVVLKTLRCDFAVFCL